MNLPAVPSLSALAIPPLVPVGFLWPLALWLLLLVPAAIAAYGAMQVRRRRHAARFSRPDLRPNLVPASPGWRRHVPVACYLLALTGLLLSLGRPQAVLAVPREQATVVLVMDTSISMSATDVQPTRFAAAGAAARRFLEILPAPFRVALVSFSASAQLVTAPTADRSEVRQALASLRPEGGTAMGDALELARGVVQSSLEAAGQPAGPGAVPGAAGAPPVQGRAPAVAPADDGPPAAILLLSDGANTAGQVQPLDAAARIQQLGVPVYTIALGTAAGVIESPDSPGQLMAVPPDEATLQQIAQLTGGQFFTAPTAADLRAVYEHIGSRIGYAQEQREITAAFAAGAAVLLAAGSAFALLWFNRFP
jgi:Ca-activated chloride channel family protein